jgi:hypothetical protein
MAEFGKYWQKRGQKILLQLFRGETKDIFCIFSIIMRKKINCELYFALIVKNARKVVLRRNCQSG